MECQNTCREAAMTIQSLRAQGQYLLGHETITRIPPHILQDPKVIFEAAYLYVVQGNFNAASKTLELVAPFHVSSAEGQYASGDRLLNEEYVCVDFLRAYVDIFRECKITSALTFAQEVYGIWMKSNSGGSYTIQGETSSAEPRMHRILWSAKFWELANHGEFDDLQAPISGSRVMIEFWYHKIVLIAAQQGLLELETTKLEAISRLNPLCRYLRSRYRTREERYFVYLLTDLLDDTEVRVAMLESFLQSLDPDSESHLILRALTFCDLAQVMLGGKKEKPHHYLEEASRLFKRCDHPHGSIDVRFLEASHGDDDRTERYRILLSLADEYAAINYPFGRLRALLKASDYARDSEILHHEIHQVLELLNVLLIEIGGEFIRGVTFVESVAASFRQATEIGGVLKSLELFFEQPPSEATPVMMGRLAMLLSLSYDSAVDHVRALSYANQAFKYFNLGKSYTDQSDAALCVAILTADHRAEKEIPTESLQRLETAIQMLEGWVGNDAKRRYIKGQRDKCVQLSRLELARWQLLKTDNSRERVVHWVKTYKELVEGEAELPDDKLLDTEVTLLCGTRKFSEALSLSWKTLNMYEQNERLMTPILLGKACLRVATCLQLIIYDSDDMAKEDVHQRAIQYLEPCIYFFKQSLTHLESAGNMELIVTCTNVLSILLQDFAERFPEKKVECYTEVLRRTISAEDICDGMRRSLDPHGGLRSFLQKRQLVSKEGHRQLYSGAVLACLRMHDVSMAWKWVQKGKARGFSDMLGAQGLTPRSLISVIQSDVEAKKLLDEEDEMVRIAQASPADEGLAAARLLENHRTQMKKVPALAQLLALREGTFGTSEEDPTLKDLARKWAPLGRKLVMVDWFIPLGKQQAAIYLFTVEIGGEPKCRLLPIRVPEVHAWIKEHLDFPEGRESSLEGGNGNKHLRQLAGLVDGLEELTDDGDLLILSPTSPLHLIPLHAIRLGCGKVLVDRNLVVYSSSLAAFHQCVLRADSRISQKSNSRTSVFMGVYEDTNKLVERSEIFKCIRRLAQSFSGVEMVGCDVNKHNFSHFAQEADWIHYHGHMVYDHPDILQQGLVLSGGPLQSGLPADPDMNYTERLTVSDIFSMNLIRNSPHVTIIACASGVSEVTAGEEPLGVISALLCAGAASTIGTLWPIRSSAGRIFAERFHRSLKTQMETHKNQRAEAGDDVLNLALAYRDAVLEMKGLEDTKAPYFWAPFVLHGAWFRYI